MIKQWQSMLDYQCFLNNSKTVFDSSERQRLHSELWIPWQKLRLFNADRAMAFLEPLYSHTGRPALNQPQIVRSFVLFFLLLSMGLTPPSLTAWVARLKHDRVLAALIGCPLSSLPPLGSYFDFMDRLWAAPSTDLYGRKKLLPASWNRKKPQKPKGKGQKAAETRPQITEAISMRILSGKDIPFNFESRLQKFFYLVAVVSSLESGLITSEKLTLSGDGTAVHTHANPRGHRSKDATVSDGDIDSAPRHFSDPDASWGWDSDLDKYYYGYTLFQFSTYNSELHTDIPLLFRFTSAKRHDSAMDNLPTYTLLKDRKISAFIDLNK